MSGPPTRTYGSIAGRYVWLKHSPFEAQYGFFFLRVYTYFFFFYTL